MSPCVAYVYSLLCCLKLLLHVDPHYSTSSHRRLFAPLRPIKWFIKPHNPLNAFAAFYCNTFVDLFLNNVVICSPHRLKGSAIRTRLRQSSLSFSSKQCVRQRDTVCGVGTTEEITQRTLICRSETRMLFALKNYTMNACMYTMKKSL